MVDAWATNTIHNLPLCLSLRVSSTLATFSSEILIRVPFEQISHQPALILFRFQALTTAAFSACSGTNNARLFSVASFLSLPRVVHAWLVCLVFGHEHFALTSLTAEKCSLSHIGCLGFSILVFWLVQARSWTLFCIWVIGFVFTINPSRKGGRLVGLT